jgi:Spy/CpxP family protein refolding chaperone
MSKHAARWVTLIGGLALTTAAVLAAGTSNNNAANCADQDTVSNRPIANFLRGAVRQLVMLRTNLNVTESQRTQIHNAVRAHREEILPIARKLAARRQALREAVLAESPNEEAIRAAADDLADTIGDAAVLASKVVAEVKPILTEKQKQTLGQFHQDRRDAVDHFLGEALPE